MWSSRRAAIEHRVGQLAKDFQTEPRPRTHRRGDAGAVPAGHPAKPAQAKHEPRSLAEQRHTWRTEAVEVLGSHRELDAMVADDHRAHRRRPAGRRHRAWVAEQAATVIATVSATRARPGRSTMSAPRCQRVLRYTDHHDTPQVAERIVAAALGEHSIAVTSHADTEMDEPAALRRRDGASVYTRHDTTVYTSADDPGRRAAHPGTPPAARRPCRRRRQHRLGPAGSPRPARVELNDGQQTLLRDMATSGARVQLALAPAGTGKTTAMAAAGAPRGSTAAALSSASPPPPQRPKCSPPTSAHRPTPSTNSSSSPRAAAAPHRPPTTPPAHGSTRIGPTHPDHRRRGRNGLHRRPGRRHRPRAGQRRQRAPDRRRPTARLRLRGRGAARHRRRPRSTDPVRRSCASPTRTPKARPAWPCATATPPASPSTSTTAACMSVPTRSPPTWPTTHGPPTSTPAATPC